jgi:hypothetical protein
VSGTLALTGAVCSSALIRRRDFVVVAHEPQPAAPEPVGTAAR